MDSEVIDNYVDHQIDLQHFGNGVIHRMLATLRRTEIDIISRIVVADLGPRQRSRLERLLAQIRRMIAASLGKIREQTEAEIKKLAKVEARFYGDAVRDLSFVGSMDNIAPTVVYSAAMSQPFRGRLLGEWFESLDMLTRNTYSETIRIAFVEGASTKSVVRRIKEQAVPGTRRNIESVVRTAMTHLSVRANLKSMEMAEVEYWQFLSILDRRTSPECRGRSGQVYKRGPNAPYPPRHINCRSTPMPLENKKPIEMPSYGDYLRRQPIERQNEILGVTRARLFRQAKLPMARFINRRGRELSLTELASRYPGYWRRAGLKAA